MAFVNGHIARICWAVAAGIALTASGFAGAARMSPAALALSVTASPSGPAATSAVAWAVGQAGSVARSQTLILAWNGRVWKRAPSPSPAGGTLSGVAATSARNAWAVGRTSSATLILRWNGRVWKRVPSPAGGALFGVAATSARNAWAVGTTNSEQQTLILRWNGRVWKRVPSPGAPEGSALSAVAATSARSAWAVGTFVKDGAIGTLTEHWNGHVWKRVPSPYGPNRQTSPTWLSGVAATSARSAWAVGSGPSSSLALRWSGRAWQRVVPHLGPSGGYSLNGVAATSARNAWTVGGSLIFHWNGTRWKQLPSPVVAGFAALSGVAATSAASAWAVGCITPAGCQHHAKTLILRWNGHVWQQVPSPTPAGNAALNGVAATSARIPS
jgi:hypothetical protein